MGMHGAMTQEETWGTSYILLCSAVRAVRTQQLTRHKFDIDQKPGRLGHLFVAGHCFALQQERSALQ